MKFPMVLILYLTITIILGGELLTIHYVAHGEGKPLFRVLLASGFNDGKAYPISV